MRKSRFTERQIVTILKDGEAGVHLGVVALDPAPDCRVVHLHAALAEPPFDIAEQERVPKVPAYGAQNQPGLRVSPLEQRWSDCLLHDLFRLPAAVGHSCSTTLKRVSKEPVRYNPRRRDSHEGSNKVAFVGFPCAYPIRQAKQ